MKKIYTALLLIITFSGFSDLVAQTYTDGPIQLMARVREINTTFVATDEALLGVGFAPDELTYKVWFRDDMDLDGAGWVGGTCLQDNFLPPTFSIDFNATEFSHTYPTATVPQFLDVRTDSWEDDLPSDGLAGFCNTGTRCSYQSSECCGIFVFGVCIGITTGDDYRCDANPHQTGLDYRLGPPCQWYNHGFLSTTNCTDNFYEPRVETFWRYTRGTGCASAIDLGGVPSGFTTITHFNSNECYTNNFPSSPGNDVFYEITVTDPVGLEITTCSAASFDTYLYLLDNTCTAIASNDNACAATSTISTSICTPGTYYIVVDGAGAADMGTFTLTVREDPAVLVKAVAGADSSICFGDTINIGGAPTAYDGFPGYLYSWAVSPGGSYISSTTDANPTISPTVDTEYILTVEDITGCQINDTINVIVDTLPVPPIAVDVNPICSTDTATFTTSGGVTYQWLIGGGTIPGATFDTFLSNTGGDHSVIAIDGNGCRDTSASIFLNVIPAPVATIAFAMPGGPDTLDICSGDSALIVGSWSGVYNYQWMRDSVNLPLPADSNAAFWQTEGDYQIIFSVAGACPDTTRSVYVNVDTLPIPVVTPTGISSFCAGDSVVLTASGGGIYQWYHNSVAISGATGTTYTATLPGEYYVEATNSFGCFALSNIDTVVTNPNPVASAVPAFASFCAGDSAILTGTGAGAGGGYEWFDGGMASVDLDSLYTEFGSDTLTLIVTNIYGCRDTSGARVVMNPLPVPTITPSGATTFCDGGSTDLTPGGGGTYQWYFNGSIIPGGTGTISADSLGTYTVEVTSDSGCVASTSQLVTVNPRPVIDSLFSTLFPPTVCPGDSVTFVAPNPGPGFQWLFNGVNIAGATNGSYTATSTGDYSVIVTNGFGCSDTSLVYNMTAHPQNTALISPPGPLPICPGETITLTGSLVNPLIVPTGYQWSVNGIDSVGATSNTIDATYPGLYAITILDNNGCPADTFVTIVRGEDPEAAITINGDIPICENGSVDLLADSSSGVYEWYRNDSLISGASGMTYTVTQEGDYKLIVTNACGADSVTVSIPVFPGADANFFWAPDPIYEGVLVDFTDESRSATLWDWSFGDGAGTSILQNPDYTYPDAGTYIVTMIIVDDAGCRDTISYPVTVLPLEDLEFPNVFSPNNDGINDLLTVDWGGMENIEMRIYDRWGVLAFETTDKTVFWDGKTNFRDAQAGTYYFVAKGLTPKGETLTFKGDILLVR